jgi:hypothetical protein
MSTNPFVPKVKPEHHQYNKINVRTIDTMPIITKAMPA